MNKGLHIFISTGPCKLWSWSWLISNWIFSGWVHPQEKYVTKIWTFILKTWTVKYRGRWQNNFKTDNHKSREKTFSFPGKGRHLGSVSDSLFVLNYKAWHKATFCVSQSTLLQRKKIFKKEKRKKERKVNWLPREQKNAACKKKSLPNFIHDTKTSLWPLSAKTWQSFLCCKKKWSSLRKTSEKRPWWWVYAKSPVSLL